MKTKLATINLETLDPQHAKDFYIDGLGMTERMDRSHPPGFVYLESEGCAMTLASPEDGIMGAPSRVFELGFETDDLAAAEARLTRSASRPVQSKSMGWGHVVETLDHDGNRVILYQFR